MSITVAALLQDGTAFSAVEDFRNCQKRRDMSNTSYRDYNCGGYALNTYNWLIPYFSGSSVDGYTWDVIYNHQGKEYDDDGYEDNGIKYESPEYYDEFLTLREEVYSKYCEIFNDWDVEELECWESEEGYGRDIEEMGIDDYRECLWQEIFNGRAYDHPVALYLAKVTMLKCFPDMRQVSSWRELKDDEYSIAYAAGDGDFHFCKFVDGKISHKPGGGYVEEVSDVEEAFGERYSSIITYFAKKKQK